MLKKKRLIGLALVAISILAAACRPSQPEPTPTVEPGVVLTAAAETANVRLTEIAAVTPTETPVPATPTPEMALTAAVLTIEAQLTQAAPVTPTLQATATAALVNTPAGPVADRASFVADVTIPDGMAFRPGTAFTKTWRLSNTGSTTWSTAYSLAFISGDKLGGPDSVRLAAQVAPGGTVDISVDLVAPNTIGNYRGYWKMLNADGRFFDEAVYVEINVTGEGTPLPGVTATATATSGAPVGQVSNVTIGVDNPNVSTTCPHTFNFSGNFTLSDPTTVTYQLEAGSETPGFTFNLPAPVTSQFPAGTHSAVYNLTFTQSVTGWVRLHITAPVDVASGQANFTLTCQP